MTDRLDRIEGLLEKLTVSLGETRAIAHSNATAILALGNKIDAIADIAESNARSIGGWSLTIEEDRADREEEDSRIRVDLNTLVRLAEGLIRERRHDWSQFRQTLSEQGTEVGQQITVLIEELRADRKTASERFEEVTEAASVDRETTAQQFADLIESNTQQFADLMEVANTDRKNNERDHKAFQENIQTQLAEIARLWHRVQAS